jgi:hypothetical protein
MPACSLLVRRTDVTVHLPPTTERSPTKETLDCSAVNRPVLLPNDQRHGVPFHSFGTRLSPDIFYAQDISTGELLRTL